MSRPNPKPLQADNRTNTKTSLELDRLRVIEKLHGVTKKIVSIIEQIILEIFSFVMLKAGLALFSKQLQTGQTTPVLKVPMSVMYFSLVLTFALILVIQAVVLVEKVMDLKNKEVEA